MSAISDDLQLDMAAGLVFAMILIYQIFMNEAREPSEPAPDSVKVTVLFREAPQDRGAVWPFTKDPNAWSGIEDELGDWDENIDDPVWRLDRLRRTLVESGYPERRSGAWGCRFFPTGFNTNSMPRYRISQDSVDPALIDFREMIDADEQVTISHSLDRFQPNLSEVSNLSQQAETWDKAVANFFPGLKSIHGANEKLWRSPVNALHCRADSKFSEQERRKIRVRLFSENEPAPSCGSNQQVISYEDKDELLENFRNRWTTNNVTEIPAVVKQVFAADPMMYSADQKRASYAVLTALWPFSEFGVFSCQATGVGVAKRDKLHLEVREALRDIKILALGIQSRSRPDGVIWQAWDEEIEFPGQVSPLPNATSPGIDVGFSLKMEFEL